MWHEEEVVPLVRVGAINRVAYDLVRGKERAEGIADAVIAALAFLPRLTSFNDKNRHTAVL